MRLLSPVGERANSASELLPDLKRSVWAACSSGRAVSLNGMFWRDCLLTQSGQSALEPPCTSLDSIRVGFPVFIVCSLCPARCYGVFKGQGVMGSAEGNLAQDKCALADDRCGRAASCWLAKCKAAGQGGRGQAARKAGGKAGGKAVRQAARQAGMEFTNAVLAERSMSQPFYMCEAGTHDDDAVTCMHCDRASSSRLAIITWEFV
jgi:hypothetical protein